MTSLIRMQTTSRDGQRIELELILNDCSIHGQFPTLSAFRDAIGRVMTIRQKARRFGRELQCHRNVVNAQVTRDLTMPQAIQALSNDKRRALMQWLTRRGPFWEDFRQHSGDNDLLEYNGELVTDTAVGEAAYCLMHGIGRVLVSLKPSCWLVSPLTVNWHDNGYIRNVGVLNYWDPIEVETALESAPIHLGSWKDLEEAARIRCPELTFAKDSFDPLKGHPFGKGTAERLLLRFNVLNVLKNCFGEQGGWTAEGRALYHKHFIGQKAWFSDSTDAEKIKFRSEFTFAHPAKAGEWLCCTWHGKVKTPQMRIHFSWPIRADEPLYIVYVGPKIAKW